jgi:crotonobetainyl-CoA:carnitine CoA-transferase CaiB-like acyl-CoA transferase
MEKIFSGVRVLDFTDALAGPFCTRYMADCGAEVLNIEKPGGKATRGVPYFFKGQGLQFLYNHCGKKSIGIDLKKEGAKRIALSLAKKCDVVIENFRPGVMASLGLDYSAFEEANPSIIMCSISGWGQNGPYAERMGADLSIQAISGILDLTGDPGKRPTLVGFPVTDILAGLNAFGAICAALFNRAKTGRGDYIDIAMADCATACLHEAFGIHTLTGGKEAMQRVGSFNNYMPSWVCSGAGTVISLSVLPRK